MLLTKIKAERTKTNKHGTSKKIRTKIQIGGNLYQDYQVVQGNLHQEEQFVNGDLYQGRNTVSGKTFNRRKKTIKN